MSTSYSWEGNIQLSNSHNEINVLATLPRGNQELLVVKDNVGRPQVSLE